MVENSYRFALLLFGLIGCARTDIWVEYDDVLPSLWPETGWHEVEGQTLQSECPEATEGYDYNFDSYCKAVVRSWSGGVADTLRNQLVIWGGGASNYGGNEVYTFDVATGRLERRTEPFEPVAIGDTCSAVLEEGCVEDCQPNGRSTYDGLAYIPSRDVMFVQGGDAANIRGYGCALHDTWSFHLDTLAWERKDPTVGGPPRSEVALAASYDSASKKVYLDDRHHLWTYDPEDNSYTRLGGNYYRSLGTTSAIDPIRRLYVLIGCRGCVLDSGMLVFDISETSDYTVDDWTNDVRGCDPLIEAPAPGFVYDSRRELFVGWPNFGDDIYLFDPNTKSCTVESFPGGPPDSVHDDHVVSTRGTFGRFQYFHDYDLFVLVNDSNVAPFVLRLPPSLRKDM